MWRGLQSLFWRGVQYESCRVTASPDPAYRFSTYKRKKAILPDGLFTCLMPGSLWRASCPPPSGPLLRNVQIRSRRICPTLESAHRQTTDKTKSPVFRPGFLLYLMPGSSLLSHGETPHYHRRYGVSLLSSAWGQVGPPR